MNRREAIRAKCLDCVGGSPGAVRGCSFADDCALWPFRSGEGQQDPSKRGQAIKNYCRWCVADNRNEVRLCPSLDCSLWSFRLAKVKSSTEPAGEAENESPGTRFPNQKERRDQRPHVGSLAGKKVSPVNQKRRGTIFQQTASLASERS